MEIIIMNSDFIRLRCYLDTENDPQATIFIETLRASLSLTDDIHLCFWGYKNGWFTNYISSLINQPNASTLKSFKRIYVGCFKKDDPDFFLCHAIDGNMQKLGGYKRSLFHPNYVSSSAESHLICISCLQVLRNPVKLKCNHVCCKSCLDLKEEDTCPKCNCLNVKSDPIKYAKIDTAIKNRRIRCPMHKIATQRCNWEGPLSEAEGHLSQCRSLPQKCERECNMFYILKDKLSHQETSCKNRIIPCPYCYQGLEYHSLKNHYNFCQKYSAPCYLLCGKEVRKCDMQHHIDHDCCNTEIPCTFAEIGCKHWVRRIDLDLHIVKFFNQHEFLRNAQNKVRRDIDAVETMLCKSSNNDNIRNIHYPNHRIQFDHSVSMYSPHIHDV